MEADKSEEAAALREREGGTYAKVEVASWEKQRDSGQVLKRNGGCGCHNGIGGGCE